MEGEGWRRERSFPPEADRGLLPPIETPAETAAGAGDTLLPYVADLVMEEAEDDGEGRP